MSVLPLICILYRYLLYKIQHERNRKNNGENCPNFCLVDEIRNIKTLRLKCRKSRPRDSKIEICAGVDPPLPQIPLRTFPVHLLLSRFLHDPHRLPLLQMNW